MGAIHANPEEAVKIHQDIGARHSVGMHWGTFVLTDEPFEEPPHRLALARREAGLKEEAFFVMKHGETRSLHALGWATAPDPVPPWALAAAARLKTA